MARPRKEGLDYFPLDVNLGYQFKAVEAFHGLRGFAIVIKIWQECYKNAAGELDISGVIRRRTIEEQFKTDSEELDSIIKVAIEVGLFDKSMWDDHKVLTSNGIKKRIDAVSKERKSARERSEMSYSGEETPKNTRRSTQSKVKYSKVKKRIVKNSKAVKHKHGEYNHVLLTDEEHERFIKDYGENIAKEAIRILDEGIEMKGYKYKNHNLALRNWPVKEAKGKEPLPF